MVSGQGGVPVEPARPVRPLTGLIVSAQAQPNGEDPRWVNGFAFQVLDCRIGGVFDPCGADVQLVIPENPDNVEYVPFAIWAGYKCSPYDRTFDWLRAASEALEMTASFQMAREFWRGELARDAAWPNRFLTDEDASDELNPGAALSPLDALACLEQYIGQCNYGQQGMIHASRQLVTHWVNGGALRKQAQRLYTVHETIVVSDGGYDGSGPTGAEEDAPTDAGATQWAYATGLITERREALTDDSITGGPDGMGTELATNTTETRATQRAAVTFSGCCHGAVEVNLQACGIGGS